MSPDPDDADEPWVWEVLEVGDAGVEYEIDMGGAASLEAAREAAEDAALAVDDEEDKDDGEEE